MAKGRKTGGRRKGTPNKAKAELLAMIQDKYPDYHPVLAMCEVANDLSNSVELRFSASREISQYVEPKRKSTEHAGADGGPVQLAVITGLPGSPNSEVSGDSE